MLAEEAAVGGLLSDTDNLSQKLFKSWSLVAELLSQGLGLRVCSLGFRVMTAHGNCAFSAGQIR